MSGGSRIFRQWVFSLSVSPLPLAHRAPRVWTRHRMTEGNIISICPVPRSLQGISRGALWKWRGGRKLLNLLVTNTTSPFIHSFIHASIHSRRIYGRRPHGFLRDVKINRHTSQAPHVNDVSQVTDNAGSVRNRKLQNHLPRDLGQWIAEPHTCILCFFAGNQTSDFWSTTPPMACKCQPRVWLTTHLLNESRGALFIACKL